MINAEIHRNDKLIMQRTYHDPSISLETVIKQLEMYIINEQLNVGSECFVRAYYTNLNKPHKVS